MPYKDRSSPQAIASARRSNRKHYEANRQAYLDRARAQRQEMTEWYQSLKHMQRCTDCRTPYPFYVLHWDHIGSDKVADLATLIRRGYNKQRILAEIAKCELVCANCHAIRTWSRNQVNAKPVVAGTHLGP